MTLIQRFGSALNLNVRLHMIILDGVYTQESTGPRYHQVKAPDQQHLEKLLNRITARVMRRLVKDGLLIQDQDQPWLDLQETDTLDTLNAASTRYRVSLGAGAGGRTLTLKNPGLQRPNSQPKPFTVDRDCFSVNAAVACQPHQRLERLCRCITRPVIWLERLSTDADGKVVYELKHPFRDGTTHILFTPQDFLVRLAALVPRPRAHLIRYHGVFAPNSPFRKSVVPGSANPACKKRTHTATPIPAELPVDRAPPTAPLTWAEA